MRAEQIACSATAFAGLRAFSEGSNLSPFGSKTLLYMRVCYADDPEEPISQAAAEAALKRADLIYRTNSYNQMSLASTVTPLLQLPKTRAEYFPPDGWNPWTLLGDARAAARAAGFDTENFDLDVIRFKASFYQSFAYIGVKGAWLVSSDVRTLVHELGHNFGLQHANAWKGGVDGPGQNIEYGNEYDIMGGALDEVGSQFSVYERQRLGWLGSSNVTTVASSGVYRIYAPDLGTIDKSRSYALRIRKDAERDFWVEKPTMFIEDDQLQNGVLIYWSPWSLSKGGTQLIDASADPRYPLVIGERLSDPEAKLHILPVQQAEDHSWIDVAVVLGVQTVTPLSLQLLPRHEGTGAFLYYSAPAGMPSLVQASSDLLHWTDFPGQTGDSAEVFVPLDSNQPARFFRVATD